MQVHELIDKLKQFDPTLEVCADYDMDLWTIHGAEESEETFQLENKPRQVVRIY